MRLEMIRVEDGPQHRADLSITLLEHVCQPFNLLVGRLVRDEVKIEAQRNETGGAAMPADDLDDMFAVEVACLAKERLLAVVCLEAGMDGYVSKPIKRVTLFGEIVRVLGIS